MKLENRIDCLEKMFKAIRSSVCYNDVQIRNLGDELKKIRELLEARDHGGDTKQP